MELSEYTILGFNTAIARARVNSEPVQPFDNRWSAWASAWIAVDAELMRHEWNV